MPIRTRFMIHLVALLLVAMTAAPAPVSAQAQRLQPPQAQAQEPWWQRAPVYNSRHYAIKSDLPREIVAEYARHLDTVFEAYMMRLRNLTLRTPQQLNVLLFSSQQEYLMTLQEQYGVNGTGSGGMFFVQRQGSGLALWTERLPRRRVHHVLQHEGFHQVAYAYFGTDLPIWVNEGLAEVFGEAILVGRELVIGQTNPRTLDALRTAIDQNRHISFREMLTMDTATWNARVRDGNARLQYQQAWSMVHFLIYGENGKYVGAFDRYLRFLNLGHNSYDAFVRGFGTDDIDSFERRWIEYAMAARPSSFITALERIEFLSAGLLELHRQAVYPTTLEELRTELRKISFRYEYSMHGVRTVLDSMNDAMFEIPRDDLARDDPAFELVPPDIRRMPRRERLLHEEYPIPAMIRTIHLRPKGLEVTWQRNPENPAEFRFEITAK